MNQEHAFLEEIIEHPDDDVPRLIFADWLEERGDPRGELIRVQCELAVAAATHRVVRALKAREQRLLAEHSEAWLAPLRALKAREIKFRRGLIEELKIDAGIFLADGDDILQVAPALSSLKLRRAAPLMAELAASPSLSRLRELSLRVNLISSDGIRQLAESPNIRNLENLDLSGNSAGSTGAESLAVCGNLPRLRYLDLWSNRIGDRGLTALAKSDLAARLTYLELGMNRITDKGARALLKDARWQNLQRFGLKGNIIGPAQQSAINTGLQADVEIEGQLSPTMARVNDDGEFINEHGDVY